MNMDESQLESIRTLMEPIFVDAQLELVELTQRRHGGGVVLRFLVDKVGGVTIQDCARLNQLIGQALDASNVIEDSYTLEVSSPGLDRPLVSKRDFERAIGEQMEIELLESLRGSKQVKGQLLAVQSEAIVVTTRAGNVTVPLTQIRSAVKAVRL
jgi:ribosome maturation factor RimP